MYMWVDAPKEYKIAIVGFGSLGKRILEKALQLNLFSVTQRLEYYVFGNAAHFKAGHSEMDLIIITERADVNLIQNVLSCSSSECKVFYYSPHDEKLYDFIAVDRLFPYGNFREVFTLENIKTDNLYQNAIKLNQQYVDKYHSARWEQLSGFFKDSNISSADYGEVVKVLHQNGSSDLQLAKLEHVRWCRFYFLRYWKYGVPADGTNKDTKEKIHKCLIPFEELDEAEQQKDLDVINMWKKEQ